MVPSHIRLGHWTQDPGETSHGTGLLGSVKISFPDLVLVTYQ